MINMDVTPPDVTEGGPIWGLWQVFGFANNLFNYEIHIDKYTFTLWQWCVWSLVFWATSKFFIVALGYDDDGFND